MTQKCRRLCAGLYSRNEGGVLYSLLHPLYSCPAKEQDIAKSALPVWALTHIIPADPAPFSGDVQRPSPLSLWGATPHTPLGEA